MINNTDTQSRLIAKCIHLLPILLLIVFIFFAPRVFATKITIVTEKWSPYIFLDDSGKVTGSMTQRVKAIMARAQLDYTISLYPWPRAYSIALNRENVLIYPIFESDERQALFHFICPFTERIDLYLFKLSTRKDIQLSSIEDAKKYRIALIRDDYDHQLFLKHGFEDGKQLDANVDDASGLKKMLKGRIDLMMQSKNGMARLLDEHNLAHDMMSQALKIENDGEGENCIALSLKTSQSIVNKVREGLGFINKTQPMLRLE
jgi:polar amino acid transport system substrate-binding protein